MDCPIPTNKHLLDYFIDELNSDNDLRLTSNQRVNAIRREVQSTNLLKLRSGATSGTAKTSDTRLTKIFGNKYELL